MPLLPRPGRALMPLLASACLGPKPARENVELLAAAVAQVQPAVMAGRLRMMLHPPQPPHVIDIPACYLRATDDRLVPERCAAEFSAVAPDLEIIAVPGPHMLLQARPAESWQAIAAWRAVEAML
jgi:pimeloyl-ACP methyl ester carboxylesterase